MAEPVEKEVQEHGEFPAALVGLLLQASYGAGARHSDVTDRLQSLLEDCEVIRVNNEQLGGDPCPGLLKSLRIVFLPAAAADGRVLVQPERPDGGGTSLKTMLEAWEGSMVDLPMGSVGAVPGACFGVGETWVDVRQLVESKVEPDGSLRFLVSCDTLGGDPAPGKRKSVRISYTLHDHRQLIAELGEWEVYEDFVADGLNGCQGAPGQTEADLAHARKRCLLLGCGGFWLSTGTVNQFGDEDSPPGCNMLLATQEEIRKRLQHRPPGHRASTLNRHLRPGIHVAPQEFVADAVWRPGKDPAPAPCISWLPEGRYCAFATQLRIPAEGVTPCSFYMCGGFHCGYCGIQQHAGKGQTILFSVWNAASGGRAVALEGGPGVKLSNFGGEGMGAKGSLDYPEPGAIWKPDTTYTFVIRADPDGDATIFSSYFFKPEDGHWRLLAKVRRPDPEAREQGCLGNPGGFLEDFGHTGSRRFGEWGPTWVQRSDGSWDSVRRVRLHDGCGRPNKGAEATADGRRLLILAGGEAINPGAALFDGDLGPCPLPECFELPVPWQPPPSSGWATGRAVAACGRPLVPAAELKVGENEQLLEFGEWDWVEPLQADKRILRAYWGANTTWVKVAAEAFSQGRAQARNDSLGGDPVPGERKFLRLYIR